MSRLSSFQREDGCDWFGKVAVVTGFVTGKWRKFCLAEWRKTDAGKALCSRAFTYLHSIRCSERDASPVSVSDSIVHTAPNAPVSSAALNA